MSRDILKAAKSASNVVAVHKVSQSMRRPLYLHIFRH